FLNLDMEEYKDLALTTAVFREVLAHDDLRDLEAGIVLQAYLPDALGALDGLTRFATERVAAGELRSRCGSSRARTSRWRPSRPSCTGGRRRRTPPSPTSTRTTCACSTTPCAPRGPTPCASASRATTCSTSRSPCSSAAPAA